MKKERFILLSFDVEEFDLPLEYGEHISLDEQLMIGNLGTEALIPILEEHKVNSTLFTTANYAMHFPQQIKALAKQHEIASHTFYHSSFTDDDLLLSKQKLEEISETSVTGLRMPRMQQIKMADVKNAGYSYDSSINPTWLPGRYNNLHLPRTLYTENGVNRLPASVSPHLRIPFFWLAFKNLPYFIFKQLAIQTLRKDGYLCLYFHPWEFTGINEY
ncbi:MAG: polysaccharide deacetylase family protein, partial [Bacteroidota bacterium]|nr:polysaccharide deacetylase family protein [Bacteroidota bacterium]